MRPGLLCVVPVLPATGPDGVPVAAARLHDRPLFAHATRTLRDAVAAPVVVGAPAAARAGVHRALLAERSGEVPVLPAGDGLGEVLVLALAEPGTYEGVLVHDPRCPLTPASCLQDAVAAWSARPDAVVVAAQVMSDTVKELVDGLVQATVDRDQLRVVASPLVLPRALLQRLHDRGLLAGCADVDDLVQLVRAEGAPLVWTPAPALARRVGDAASVALLECLTELR